MRKLRKTISCLTSVVLVQAVMIAAASAADYVATDLPAGTVLRNNNGVLVTRVYDGPGYPGLTTTTSIIKNGVVIAAYKWPVDSSDSPLDINDADTVVGLRFLNPSHFHALVYKDHQSIDLHPTLAAAFGVDSATSTSDATDINDRGEIIGMVTSGTARYPYLYKDGVVTDLKAASNGAIDTATGINNLGQITGTMTGTDARAYVYAQGVVTPLDYPDQAWHPSGGVINSAGQVSGNLQFPRNNPPPVGHAFYYEGGDLHDIGIAGASTTTPRDINNAGDAVGYINVDNYGFFGWVYRGGVISQLTGLVDAASLHGRTISDALSIGNDGSILAIASNAPVLLTPTFPTAIDPSVFNFESGAQGWESSGEPIVTVATSTAQKFAGAKSLAIQFNSDGFAAVRVAHPTARPGDTISYRIFVPLNSKIDWVQPYALGGADDNWSWYGAWTPVEALQLGAWNTITIAVPADAHALNAIGVEIFSSDPTPGTVYLDSVDYGVTPDFAQYNFETGTQNWESDGDALALVTTSAAQTFKGRKSLALDLRQPGLARVSVANPSVQAGQTITFNVYIPAGVKVDSVQPYAIEGEAGNWAWHGNWQPIGALQSDAWNTISVNVPAGAQSLAALGIELSASDTNAGIVYVDSVSY